MKNPTTLIDYDHYRQEARNARHAARANLIGRWFRLPNLGKPVMPLTSREVCHAPRSYLGA